ncbi:MAG: type II toxin-antitoxin system VapC family toxin [Verrucomicrobia bacterium]|nr:type II toxin-antitoxin system VapC family toxin [Verrucomicrobiota bacterium]
MNLLADAEWLIRLEREIRQTAKNEKPGPALRMLSDRQVSVFINTISVCEFLAGGRTADRIKLLQGLRTTKALDYGVANKAAELRCARAKQGKTLHTPDALMAASAITYKMRLMTADKDFSGIPGLDWSSYAD